MIKKNIQSPDHVLQDLTNVSTVVSPLLKKLFGKKGLVELEIMQSWKQIVGEELAQYSFPNKITFRKNEKNNGCLHLSVLSGAFAMEISQKSRHIIEQVNTFFGYPAISDIKIIQVASPENFLIKKKNDVNIKKTLVSQQEEIYITKLIEGIHSPELRITLEKLGRAVFGNRKKQE